MVALVGLAAALGGVSQGIGAVMGFATAAVEALFEQAYFGFEFGDALLRFVLALLQACGKAGVALSELFFEFGFAQGSAVVEGLIEARLLTGVPESLLAGREFAGSVGGFRLQDAGFHQRKYAKAAAQLVGQ